MSPELMIFFSAVASSVDPPEMNTSQLLLVSSIGLGINLFGMFATGGHAHHGVRYLVPLAHVLESESASLTYWRTRLFPLHSTRMVAIRTQLLLPLNRSRSTLPR